MQPALKECDLHGQRINYALEKLNGKLPLTAKQWDNLDDETVADIDQLLFRYTKLQDAMGQRLFPAILEAAGDWREEEAFIDKLNRLEKLRAIPSAEQWMETRRSRNRIAHEYPDAPEKNAANLNAVFDSLDVVKVTLKQSRDYALDLADRLKN